MVYLRNRCARKAFDKIESSHKSIFFSEKKLCFFHARGRGSELPSITNNMRAQHVLSYHLTQVPWLVFPISYTRIRGNILRIAIHFPPLGCIRFPPPLPNVFPCFPPVLPLFSPCVPRGGVAAAKKAQTL